MAEKPLAQRKCVPCVEGTPPLEGEALLGLAGQVPDWHLVGEHYLERTFKFRDFKQAFDWVGRVGALAERIGHYPWIHFTRGVVRLELYTREVDGLVENDLILAARVDKLWDQVKDAYA